MRRSYIQELRQHCRLVATEHLRREAQMLFELLKQLLEGLQTRQEGGVRSEREKARLTKLADHDNIEAYLTTFERIMVMYKVHSYVHLILTGLTFSLQATLPGAQ